MFHHIQLLVKSTLQPMQTIIHENRLQLGEDSDSRVFE
jgi:hypothetical protein